MGLQTEKAPILKSYIVPDTTPWFDGHVEFPTLEQQRDADHKYYLAKMREVVEGKIQDTLLQLYNDGFIQGELGFGNDQESIELATQAILKAMED